MSKNIKRSPLKVIGSTINFLGAYDWGGKRKKAQVESQAEYDKQKKAWLGMDFSNIYGDVSNPYANLENTMEDLTVNQQQAQFEKQMAQQSQANVMQGMRGAAGGSGIAGLAQAMANQGSMQAQRASASIGQQEAANQKAKANQAAQISQLERQGAWKADMTRRAGAETERKMEQDRTRTQFAMSQQRKQYADQAVEEGKDRMWGAAGDAFSLTGMLGL